MKRLVYIWKLFSDSKCLSKCQAVISCLGAKKRLSKYIFPDYLENGAGYWLHTGCLSFFHPEFLCCRAVLSVLTGAREALQAPDSPGEESALQAEPEGSGGDHLLGGFTL